jgi:hypothetical protein
VCPITAIAERRRGFAFDAAEDAVLLEMKTRRGLGGLSRQNLGVKHELAAGSASIGGDDRSLDAELVGCAGLAFANAFDLGRVEE